MAAAGRRPDYSAESPALAQSRAREAHQRGLRAGAAGHPAVAARQTRAGLTLLGWREDAGQPDSQVLPETHHALGGRLLMSLAHFEAERGQTEYGLRLLARAEDLAAPDDRGVLLSQRGLLLMRTWQGNEALRVLDDAVALLEENPAERAVLARALLNRSFEHLNLGHPRRARADAVWCERIAVQERLELITAKAVHNQGFCELLAGDIPAALQLFTVAADGYRRHAPGFLPVLATDKARALLAVGLAGDAATELENAITAFQRQHLTQDLADAELARAQAALGAGQPDVARRWAAAAGRRFRRRGNAACSALAELIRLRARLDSPGRPGPVAAQARSLAGRLRDCGLGNDADLAELIAARALARAGRGGEARQRLAAVRRRGPAVTLDVSLMHRLARAELAEMEGQSGRALAELRAGLALVHTRRGRLGSLDLQTGTAALGADLAAAGLRLALRRRSARLVFAWLERCRAQAFRVRPVRPPADEEVAASLAELRQLSRMVRSAELNGRRDPVMTARCARLQREIRERTWQASGPGEAIGPASIAEIGAVLAQSGQALVDLLAHDGRLFAVVLRRGSVRLASLGDAGAAAEAARRLNADLDTLAGRRLPTRLAAVIMDSIRHQAEVLTAEVTAPLRPWLGEEGVVLVPAGALASIPWGILPDMRGRPVTVCPSAYSWLEAWRRDLAAGAIPQSQPPLLIAGPDLRHAAREVRELAKVYPRSRPLLERTATVSTTLRALDGAALAHLAVHGHHEQENFLFSRLDLTDGPLMAYDIQQLAAPPRQVVLSACDVGRTVVRPGEEILGFTAALLYVGTATVISSVARVSDDDAAVAMMTGYHRRLSSGTRPAEALATATAAEPLSPFVCFGSG